MNSYGNLALFTGPFLIVLFLIIAVSLLVSILYLLTLQNVMKQVSPKNQDVPPVNVWLMFIPFFNIIYPFILYPRICDSIKKEYSLRGLQESGNFGRSIGIAMPILSLCAIIPVLGVLAAFTNIVLFIIFWSKMGGYKATLIQNPLNSEPELLDSVEMEG
jgi:hypothetical protein